MTQSQRSGIAGLPDSKGRGEGRNRPLGKLWRRIREPLSASPRAKNVLAAVIAAALRFVVRTNRKMDGSVEPISVIRPDRPVIVALWHGQHLIAPALTHPDISIVALFSKSADAELNALVAERLGFGIIRGSGGREGHDVKKGGARALIAMKRVLDTGRHATMIADIPHGTPREAGLGIVTLARISGRPILPMAVATSRRKVLEKSWDKTTINLPFGRLAITSGALIDVPREADDAVLEDKRREVTAGLDDVTRRAYAMVDAT